MNQNSRSHSNSVYDQGTIAYLILPKLSVIQKHVLEDIYHLTLLLLSASSAGFDPINTEMLDAFFGTGRLEVSDTLDVISHNILWKLVHRK